MTAEETSVKMTFIRALLVVLCVSVSSAVRILSGALSCGRQDVSCTVSTSNCMDRGWLVSHEYTPSGPEELQASVDSRQDEAGNLQPVLNATWKIRDDGSINFLKATELHVLVESTNQNLCVRYSFKDKLPMRTPKWSFSADMLVLVPGETYRVSVFNIPKPELGHTYYDVSARVTVPDCRHPKMKMTQFCIETGSLWEPNISLAQITADGGKSALAVSFNTDRQCEEYDVIVSCDAVKHNQSIKKNNLTVLNMSFILDKWPRSCCQFAVEINPLFPLCRPDCIRLKKPQDICTATPKPTDAPDVLWYALIAIGVVSMCIMMAVVIYVRRRKSGKTAAVGKDEKPWQQPLKQPPKVLVIYSQDHHLYRDVVLQLCSFLRAKCGTEVLVDLLDSTSVSMVGRHRWLEWQRQQLKNPSDKILVLCSQGVQAKWRAMCGQKPVTLREDITSPTDDMLTPFLNLFLTDMHQAGMRSKYMVAYFGDIGSELDVPSVFDVAVKYNLMKHFEELYFRILDIEKYQPGCVNHIEGIGGDEYFHCPSGRDLKKAIEAFQAYQMENPDWFERECVDSEEEVDVSPLIDQLQIPVVQEFVPVIRDEPSVFIHEVEINENHNSIHIVAPELNPEHQLSLVAELLPVVNPECRHLSSLDEVLTDHLYPHSPSPASVYSAEPVLNKLPPPRQNWLPLREEPLAQVPTEDDEEDSLLPMNQHFAHFDQRISTPQNSLDSKFPDPSCANIPSEYFPSSEVSHPQPMDMEGDKGLDSRKGPSSGSDQGYSSKISSQHEAPFKEDPLVTLMRLQQQQFLQNPRYSDRDPEEPYEH